MNKFHMQIDHLNTFIEKNVYLTTLKNTFKAIMPLILLGSVITLVNVLLSNLEFLKVVFSQTLFSTLNSIVTGIMDNLALFVAFICGFYMGKMRKMDSIRCGIISLTCFLTIYFQSISFLKSGIQPIQKFDSEYLFFSLLISILSVELFRLVLKRTVFKNKYFPEELTSFPAFLFVVIIFILVNYMVFLFSNRTIFELVNIIIRTPIEYFFQTAYGIVFAVLFSQLLWFFGIHGGQIISPIRNPVFLINIAANISNYNSGEQPDQVLTFAFWRCFVTAGGIGYLVSLSIIYLLFSKSKKNKSIMKISFIPAIFGISEPIIYGLPLVFNQYFFFPFLLCPTFSTITALLAFKSGFLTVNIIDVPFGIPILFNAFISYGVNGVLVQLFCIIVSAFIWFPFVRLNDNRSEEYEI